MKLFQIHAGYYDLTICDGAYEFHVNFFVVAEDFDGARARAKEIPEFRERKMHVDGITEIQRVGGFDLSLVPAASGSPDQIVCHRFRELAPKKPTETL